MSITITVYGLTGLRPGITSSSSSSSRSSSTSSSSSSSTTIVLVVSLTTQYQCSDVASSIYDIF